MSRPQILSEALQKTGGRFYRVFEDRVKAFAESEHASRDVLVVQRSYIDVAGDLATGVLLAQIVYWSLPDKNGKSKLRVAKKDKRTGDPAFWIAKTAKEWFEETRLSAKQLTRAMNKLVGKGIIVRQFGLFDGLRTMHVRLEWEIFIDALEAARTLPDFEEPVPVEKPRRDQYPTLHPRKKRQIGSDIKSRPVATKSPDHGSDIKSRPITETTRSHRQRAPSSPPPQGEVLSHTPRSTSPVRPYLASYEAEDEDVGAIAPAREAAG